MIGLMMSFNSSPIKKINKIENVRPLVLNWGVEMGVEGRKLLERVC
jgi:hypothetical protein